MFCPKCGSPNPDGARFCAKCGGGLGVAEGPASGTATGYDTGSTRGLGGANGAKGANGSRIAVGKNPTVALVLAIFLGGLGVGQFYNGDWKKGLTMAAISIGLGVATGGLASLAVWIWSMPDAYLVAKGDWKMW